MLNVDDQMIIMLCCTKINYSNLKRQNPNWIRCTPGRIQSHGSGWHQRRTTANGLGRRQTLSESVPEFCWLDFVLIKWPAVVIFQSLQPSLSMIKCMIFQPLKNQKLSPRSLHSAQPKKIKLISTWDFSSKFAIPPTNNSGFSLFPICFISVFPIYSISIIWTA